MMDVGHFENEVKQKPQSHIQDSIFALTPSCLELIFCARPARANGTRDLFEACTQCIKMTNKISDFFAITLRWIDRIGRKSIENYFATTLKRNSFEECLKIVGMMSNTLRHEATTSIALYAAYPTIWPYYLFIRAFEQIKSTSIVLLFVWQ